MTRILIADGKRRRPEVAQTAHRVSPRLDCLRRAIDGEDAQRKARELRPDLIILDLAMSGLKRPPRRPRDFQDSAERSNLAPYRDNIPAVIAEAKSSAFAA